MKKKVGRPAMSADKKRKPRTFKATDTEWQAIQRMAAERGLSASEYIRNVTLRKEDDYMKNELKAILESGDVSRMKAVVKEGITNDKNCNFLGFCEVESPSDTLLQVSIHAPARGATPGQSCERDWRMTFQSTHPRGVRP